MSANDTRGACRPPNTKFAAVIHPKIVSEMLGHSTVAITLDVYSHVTPAIHREAADVMERLLGAPPL
jgi:integrase